MHLLGEIEIRKVFVKGIGILVWKAVEEVCRFLAALRVLILRKLSLVRSGSKFKLLVPFLCNVAVV